MVWADTVIRGEPVTGPTVLLFTRPRDLEVWIDTLGDRSAEGTTAPDAEDGTETC